MAKQVPSYQSTTHQIPKKDGVASQSVSVVNNINWFKPPRYVPYAPIKPEALNDIINEITTLTPESFQQALLNLSNPSSKLPRIVLIDVNLENCVLLGKPKVHAKSPYFTHVTDEVCAITDDQGNVMSTPMRHFKNLEKGSIGPNSLVILNPVVFFDQGYSTKTCSEYHIQINHPKQGLLWVFKVKNKWVMPREQPDDMENITNEYLQHCGVPELNHDSNFVKVAHSQEEIMLALTIKDGNASRSTTTKTNGPQRGVTMVLTNAHTTTKENLDVTYLVKFFYVYDRDCQMYYGGPVYDVFDCLLMLKTFIKLAKRNIPGKFTITKDDTKDARTFLTFDPIKVKQYIDTLKFTFNSEFKVQFENLIAKVNNHRNAGFDCHCWQLAASPGSEVNIKISKCTSAKVIKNTVAEILSLLGVPVQFSNYAYLYVLNYHNMKTYSGCKQLPFTAYTGKSPNADCLKPFGCLMTYEGRNLVVDAYRPVRCGVFLGTSTKGHIVIDIESKTIKSFQYGKFYPIFPFHSGLFEMEGVNEHHRNQKGRITSILEDLGKAVVAPPTVL